MATFADIKKVSGRKKPFLFTDGVPTGHFGATITVDDLSSIFLLEGSFGDLNAVIKGHVRTVPPIDVHSPNSLEVYRGDALRGGVYLGRGYTSRDFGENFKMILAS